MIKLKFKQTNQKTTPRYHRTAPATGDSVGDTARDDSNADGTARPGWPVTLVPTRPTTSSLMGDTAHAPVGRGCRAGGTATHWNEP
jgi:hypothetical protein